MLAKAILVHGVIGYKFSWLLPSEDHNQGTPTGHVSNGTTVRDHWEDMNQLRHQLGTNHCWHIEFVCFFPLLTLEPHRIMSYRDGVSEGQFSQVLLHEMYFITKACASLEDECC